MPADLRHIVRSRLVPLVLYLLLTGFPGFSQQSRDTSADSVVREDMSTDTVSTNFAPPTSGDPATPGGSTGEGAHEEPARLRQLPDSVVRRYQKEDEFAYANDPAYWKRPEYHPSAFALWLRRILQSGVVKWAIYLTLGGVLLYVVFRIISENNLTGFYRTPARIRNAQEKEDPVDEDIDKKLRQALHAGDYRSAVRYMYLGTLRQLRDKEWIQYHIESTNQEYVRQLSTLPQGPSFRWLTGAYEHVWYGEFPVGPDQFGRLQKYFIDFNKSVADS